MSSRSGADGGAGGGLGGAGRDGGLGGGFGGDGGGLGSGGKDGTGGGLGESGGACGSGGGGGAHPNIAGVGLQPAVHPEVAKHVANAPSAGDGSVLPMQMAKVSSQLQYAAVDDALYVVHAPAVPRLMTMPDSSTFGSAPPLLYTSTPPTSIFQETSPYASLRISYDMQS